MIGVVLCRCSNRIDGILDLEEVEHFLKRRMPELPIVVADRLCEQPEALLELTQKRKVQRLVMGICSDPEHLTRVIRGAKRAGLESPALNIVDLKKESTSNYRGEELTDRAKLLVWAQVRRSSVSNKVPEDRRELCFEKPRGEISRRQLLSLIMPRYKVTPCIETAECRECWLCVDACPFDAIAIEEDKVTIDGFKCRGCGACAVTCPQRAISYPAFSLEQLDMELEGLLLSGDVGLEPRIVALTCQGGAGEGEHTHYNYPPNVLPLEVPCLAMVSPWLVLRAFDRGAQGLALISSRGTCQLGLDPARWQGNLQFVQELLTCWGIQSGCIRTFEATEANPHALEQGLEEFARDLADWRPFPIEHPVPTRVPEEGLWLPSLIEGMERKLGHLPDRTVSTGIVPFGKVELDSSQCTGCGLCALSCTTGALAISQDEEGATYQLLFRHDSCVACGKCVESCPETCLRLDQVLALAALGSPPEVLFEDRLVRCQRCGKPIASGAMLDRLQARVSGVAGALDLTSDICPVCAITDQFNLIRANEGVTR